MERYLDDNGKIKTWPAKKDFKLQVLKYLSEKFEYDKVYSEKEVNIIIEEWHTFKDFFLLRRGLVDYKLLFRERDGSKYWRAEE